MLGRIWRLKHATSFLGGRVDDYVQLARLDGAVFRRQLAQTLLGATVLALSGLLFLCFLSVAVIVTAWDSEQRVLVAWLVCLAWALLGGGGLVVVVQSLKHPNPFEDLATEISRDLAVVKEML